MSVVSLFSELDDSFLKGFIAAHVKTSSNRSQLHDDASKTQYRVKLPLAGCHANLKWAFFLSDRVVPLLLLLSLLWETGK